MMTPQFFVRYLKTKLGLAGIMGLFVSAVVLMCVLFQLLPLMQQVSDAKIAAEKNASQPISSQIAAKEEIEDETSVDQFYAQFSTVKELPDILKTISDTGLNLGIALKQADYLLSNEQSGKLMRYEISVPVKSSYPKIKRLIDQLSRKIPTMGLAEINLKREDSNAAGVEAKLSFVLYLKAER